MGFGTGLKAKAVTTPMNDTKTPKKGKTGLVVLLVIIFIILGGVILVVFDAFGVRSNMLFPFLGNIAAEGGYNTPEEEILAVMAGLQEEIKASAAAKTLLEENLRNLTQSIEQMERENARLREFEAMHKDFQQYRDDFYRGVFAENPDGFMEFFVTTNPALAQEIFRGLAGAQMAEEEWQNYLATWSAMSPVQVAMIIEDMLTTEMPLIVRVMSEMPEHFRGAVLNNLTVESAGAVLRQMEP